MKRLRLLGALAATLLVVAAVFVVVSSLPAPEIDPATPRRQNGFTLVRVQQTEYSETPLPRPSPVMRAFWSLFYRLFPAHSGTMGVTEIPLAEPGLRIADARRAALMPGSFAHDDYRVIARASTGDTFPLRWSDDLTNDEAFLNVVTPVGYPDTYRWLDVSVTHRKSGDTARWRLRDLPRARHALAPPAAFSASQTTHNVSLEAQAWAGRRTRPSGGYHALPAEWSVPLFVAVRGVNHNPPGVEPWRVEIKKVEAEWQGAPGCRNQYVTGGGSLGTVSGRNGALVHSQTQIYPLPCAPAQRVVRIHALLTQHRWRTETATFRDLPLRRAGGRLLFALPKPRTITTRAGVKLVLSDDAPKNAFFGGPQNIAFRLRVEPTWPGNKGVRVRAQVAGNQGHFASVFNSDDWNAVTPRRVPASGRLETLSFTVTQEATLETVPLTFTVPVSQTRTAADWGR